MRLQGARFGRHFNENLIPLYKGEEEEFLRVNPEGGFSMYNPPSWVSGHFHLSIRF